MTGGGQLTLLERMALLQEQSAELQQQLRDTEQAVERELAAYVPTDPVHVTVTLTESGFPSGLAIVGPAEDRTAAAYTTAIGSAFQLTQATSAKTPIEVSKAIIDAVTSGAELPSVTVSDDFGQLSVTASFGNVQGVQAKDQWVRSCSDQTIADEVLRIAQQAAKASDAFHRFDEEGPRG
jgi:hypothetical protein